MSKPKLKEKEIEARANETKNQKFHRIVNPRIVKMRYELGRIQKMITSSSYDITQTDAQTILKTLTPELDSFVTLLQKLSNGEVVSSKKKDDIKNIF